MKTITVDFKRGEDLVARVVGKFERVPGLGNLVWIGEDIATPLGSALPKEHYAELFEESMTHLAKKAGLSTVITKDGEWETFSE